MTTRAPAVLKSHQNLQTKTRPDLYIPIPKYAYPWAETSSPEIHVRSNSNIWFCPKPSTLCWTPDSGVTVQHHQAKWCWPPRFVQNTCSDWQYWARWWIGAPLNRQACIYWDVMWSWLRFHDSKIFHLTKVSQLRSFLWKGLFTWKLYFHHVFHGMHKSNFK